MSKTTNKKCPGCGEVPAYVGRPGFRNVGEVCPECKDRLKKSDEIIAREKERAAELKTAGEVLRVSDRWHDFKGYYERGTKGHTRGFSRETQDGLSKARFALYHAVSKPLPTTRGWCCEDREFPPGAVEALEHYDSVVREAMIEFARGAYADGADALKRLAQGKMTTEEFEDKAKEKR